METRVEPAAGSRRIEIAVSSLLTPLDGARHENQDNYLVISDTGQARYLVSQRPVSRPVAGWPEGYVRLAVLDGMGGHSFGREVAERAVEGLMGISPADPAVRDRAIVALHQRLRQQMHLGGGMPGCTLTLLDVSPEGAGELFHVGDSRLYAVDRHATFCLTVDHVPATKHALGFETTARAWRDTVHGVNGFLISQAFVLGNLFEGDPGAHDTLYPGLFELDDDNLPAFLRGLGDRRRVSLQAEPTYLLATDGLWDVEAPAEFVSTWPALIAGASGLEEGLEALLEALRREASRSPQALGDNVSVIAFRRAG